MAKTEYSRILTAFGGIDVTSDDSNVALNRFPYIVNMWRDFKSENGAAVETFPGWRMIPWNTGSENRINGLYFATLSHENSMHKIVIIHKGHEVYYGDAEDKDTEKQLTKIGECQGIDSRGFQHGNAFYLLDQNTIYKLALKNGTLSMSEVGTEAYIPTTYADGAEYEQRNMLTNQFYHKYNIQKPEEITTPGAGITFTIRSDKPDEAEVTAIDSKLEYVYIPSTCTINGKQYTVTKIAADVGTWHGAIKTLVTGPKVAEIGDNCFTSCPELTNVILHGVKSIGNDAFSWTATQAEHLRPSVRYMWIQDTLQNLGYEAIDTEQKNTHIFFSGTDSQAAGLKLYSHGRAVNCDAAIYFTTVGNTLGVGLSGDKDLTLKQFGNSYSITDVYSYDVVEIEVVEEHTHTLQFALKNKVAALMLLIKYKDNSGTEYRKHVAITAKSDTIINPQESAYTYYRFDLYDPTISVESVTVDGNEIDYDTITEERDQKTYIKAITYYTGRDSILGKQMIIAATAHDSEFARSKAGEDYTYGNNEYIGTSAEAIKKCTLYAEYDGRIFLSGNPDLPNTVFYSNRNLSGVNDPTYFGQLNYFNDGYGNNSVASLLSTPSFLAVIKRDSGIDGSVYYHTPQFTEYDMLPKIYPSTQGAANIGSLGPAINFRDDPVFISADGLESISLSTVNSERGLYHRSTNVDKWLLAELATGSAEITVWEGYLIVLCNGKIFMADSRQISKVNGYAQYEWYYLDDVGVYKGQTTSYYYPSASPYTADSIKLTDCYIDGIKLEVKQNEYEFTGNLVIDRPTLDEDGIYPITDDVVYSKEADENGQVHNYILATYGEQVSGEFKAATKICTIGDELLFGTEDGSLCIINTDKRGISANGDEVPSDRIHYNWYTRCGRRYRAGFATKKDNCDIPYYDKDTVGKSLVIKAKTMQHSSFEVRVRSDREPWTIIQNSTAAGADGYDVDFSNASFVTSEETIRQLRERSRRWVEKQYYVSSGEYKRPFGIYSIAYRYKISGLNGRIRRH